jgi:chromosome partitioning protein
VYRTTHTHAPTHQRADASPHLPVCTPTHPCYNASMHLIVLHTPKGGSGKSTVARELAVAADRAGIRVALADLDPQGTTTGWYDRRKAETPALVRFDPADDGLRVGSVDWLIVDTPPGAPGFMPKLLARADLVLVPVRPSPDDLLAAAPIARSLARHPAWAFVMCQVPTRSRLVPGAVRQLAALGRVAPVQLGFRGDFPAAAISGEAAIEFSGSKASDEVAALYAYARDLIGDTDGPPTKRRPR